MRKITEDSVKAFFDNYNFKKDNTQVEHDDFETTLKLHGHTIAKRNKKTGIVYLSDCGWQTNTTKERLNGILDHLYVPRIYQRDFVWYWKDGETWEAGYNIIAL